MLRFFNEHSVAWDVSNHSFNKFCPDRTPLTTPFVLRGTNFSLVERYQVTRRTECCVESRSQGYAAPIIPLHLIQRYIRLIRRTFLCIATEMAGLIT